MSKAFRRAHPICNSLRSKRSLVRGEALKHARKRSKERYPLGAQAVGTRRVFPPCVSLVIILSAESVLLATEEGHGGAEMPASDCLGRARAGRLHSVILSSYNRPGGVGESADVLARLCQLAISSTS